MSVISCPYCNAETEHFLSAADINRKTTDTLFHLNKCGSCKLLFITNPPEDLGIYYAQDYHGTPKNRAELEKALPAQRSKIEILLPYKDSGDLLEIGPSVGYFCALAQDNGFNVSAIEMDEDCVRFLDRELGVDVTQSSDPATVLQTETKSYDAICMWHSIEHMNNPWDVFEAAAARLKPGGVFLVAAPNPESVQARTMGKYWPHHDLPRHLFGIPMHWLNRLAEKNGLKTVLQTTTDKESIYWNRFSWAMKIRALTHWLPSRLHQYIWTAGLHFAKVFAPWEDREGQGACYVMIFQKPE